jgi:malonate transporter and related proteins
LTAFIHLLVLSLPLFAIIAIGYVVARVFHVSERWIDRLSMLCFTVLLPALLFRLMSTTSSLPPVDARLLIAFFGGCLIVFVIGRVLAWQLFKLDGVSQSVFALGGVFSNNVLLGLPLAKLMLGDTALPSVALVLMFNALILWTLVTVSIEWARHGSVSFQGFARTALSVASNPIVAGIVLGTLYGRFIGALPDPVNQALTLIGDATAPVVLFVLGVSLTKYTVSDAWRESLAICVLKLIVQPLVVYALAITLHLPAMETRVVVLLASISVGVNVYLMARQFNTLHTAVASSLVLSTLLAAFTTPLLLTLVGL